MHHRLVTFVECAESRTIAALSRAGKGGIGSLRSELSHCGHGSFREIAYGYLTIFWGPSRFGREIARQKAVLPKTKPRTAKQPLSTQLPRADYSSRLLS